MRGCGVEITKFTHGGKEYTVKCGEHHGGRMELCDKCEKEAQRRYPQGWVSYPGDVCEHGTYVGGCGVDWICGRCENGD